MENEKRLIDANALIAEYYRVHIGEPGKARKLIADAPDVEPVRHGRWNDWEVFWKECSCCGYRTQKINAREYFFCPKCGTKMNEEGTHER